MAGFIILNDGRAWSAANWAYDAAIRCIAEALPSTQNASALSKWLLEQTSEIQGMGLGNVDLRELTAENQALFIQAVRKAATNIKNQGVEGWAAPSFFPAWQERFEALLKLIESIDEEHMSTTYRCPICALELPAHPRYPRYVCQDCKAKARSADGRPLEFFNASLGGGFLAQYADTKENYPSHDCYIDGVKCWADEAYFGGIVIEVLEAS